MAFTIPSLPAPGRLSTSQNPAPIQVPAPSTSAFGKWIVPFGAFGLLMFGMSNSEKYGDIAASLSWLVALGATAYWWPAISASWGEISS